MGKKQKRSRMKVSDEKTFAIISGVATIAGLVIGIKSGLSGGKATQFKTVTNTVAKAVSKPEVVQATSKAVDVGKVAVKDIAANAQKAARYEVQFKAFKTGEWYTKTLTDFKNSAYSVAKACSQGRASRVIDHLTGEIVNIFEGAPEIYAKYLK